MIRSKMRIGKISTFIALCTRPAVVNEPHVAASGLKAAPLLSKQLVSELGQAESGSTCSKAFKTIALFGAGFLSCTTMAYASDGVENGLGCPCYPWPNKGIPGSHNQASGLQIFQNACSSCHTTSFVSYRDVAYTVEETKAMSAEIEVVDGLNVKGEIVVLQAKNDHFPQPYAIEKAARLANGGASPLHLSLITKIREGLHYNPYFSGGAIALPKMLNDSAVQYEMGKDFTTNLPWSALLNQKLMNRS